MSTSVKFKVGNTYRRIPRERAKLSRNGLYKKIHDVTIFVDVVGGGNAETIERVIFHLGQSFVPRKFTCTTPIPMKSCTTQDKIWRFATRQQVYGSFNAKINIIGMGGTSRTVSHDIVISEDAEHRAYDRNDMNFREPKPFRPMRMLKVPDHANFGVELELTSPINMDLDIIASHINSNAGRGGGRVMEEIVDVIYDYRAGRVTSQHWKIVPDSSIECSNVVPNCHKFELVSPILTGGRGLGHISNVLKCINSMQTRPILNKSMGFHVHIDVSTLDTSQLVKICQQFIKYEEVFDTIMPPSRRTGSRESREYFQSNRQSIVEATKQQQRVVEGTSTRATMTMTNRQCHDALAECEDIHSLVSLMNRSGRYHKLNMQNLITGRQPTIEFRQHSATVNYDKVSAWIRLCILFCYNAARLSKPTTFREQGRSILDKFDALFLFVVKDRALRDFYRKRRSTLSYSSSGDDNDDAGGNENCACCDECATSPGGSCI